MNVLFWAFFLVFSSAKEKQVSNKSEALNVFLNVMSLNKTNKFEVNLTAEGSNLVCMKTRESLKLIWICIVNYHYSFIDCLNQLFQKIARNVDNLKRIYENLSTEAEKIVLVVNVEDEVHEI